ncbi:leucine-rich repeat-containing protein kinase family protein [Botryobacter ruber]|uniref:leucine-rich repeat-containing protein kinase family protein n=1 Tax=Botryobacter ruber TaxID=2171629 RepID=UPI000E0BBDB1|nr:leucine-rich repeat-containing protein kinase family protein [Botryobacter ruber]
MQTLQQLKAGQLAGAKRLKLACGLTEFPREILELHETLEVLDLSGNHLTHLPEDFAQLQHLKIAFFSDNDFTEFPAVLGKCPNLEMVGFKACRIRQIPAEAFPLQLRWLIVTNNQIAEIPASIGKCARLQKLMLAGNNLTHLPSELANCLNLQLLRISANKLEQLPDWLFTMPLLSWLAFGGNPCVKPVQENCDLAEINWRDLAVEQQLGEGASGLIAKAHWHSSNRGSKPKQVAVKVFKGKVTSDGLPADEMTACMAAGTHANLVQVLGKVANHPEQKQALVLELIPPAFRNLGGPPSFETCTRDTFPPGTSFSVTEISTIALGIAAAAAHLHARGIMHGDLYAHNILVNETAHPLLGDFGAATAYEAADPEKRAALERLEVRAFGCLLEDLLGYVAPADSSHPCLPALTRLKQACMHLHVKQRPGFAVILESLKLLSVPEPAPASADLV